ncbi:hypothetical protein JCM14036_03480 [Desulfotomaculum defluvii]
MLYAKNTPNNTGVAIYGDFMDFEALYDQLHEIVGDEGVYPSYDTARIRVLGVCYDLRHAMMGDREIEFIDNGMDQDKMRRLSTITSDKNIYLVINVLWPEMLFVLMALNDFVLLHARKQAKNTYTVMRHHKNIWDNSIAQVRFFQAAVAKCLKETVSEASYTRMINLMTKDYTWFDNYMTQYLDLLNLKFIEMDKEKRLKSIPTMAKRLVEKGKEYINLKEDLEEAAKLHNCSVKNLRLKKDYPENIEW